MHLKFGKITEVDAAKGLAKVTFEEDDNLLSDWLPMAMPKTLQDKFIIPFDINEHVYCIMDEHCESGVIAGAIYDEANLPDGGAVGKSRVKFGVNLWVEYDRSTATLSIAGTGKFTIDINGDANIKCGKAIIESTTDAEVKAATIIKLTAPIVQCSAVLKAASIQTTGGAGLQINAAGEIIAPKVTAAEVKEGIVRLGTHTHTGVTTGGGTSGPPTP